MEINWKKRSNFAKANQQIDCRFTRHHPSVEINTLHQFCIPMPHFDIRIRLFSFFLIFFSNFVFFQKTWKMTASKDVEDFVKMDEEMCRLGLKSKLLFKKCLL